MDKDELIKRLNDLHEKVEQIEDEMYRIRQDLFGLIDDVEIHLVDYTESEE